MPATIISHWYFCEVTNKTVKMENIVILKSTIKLIKVIDD